MKHLLTLAGLALFTLSAVQAQNRKIQFIQGDLASVLAKAKAEQKPVFVDAFTTWCGPCKWLDKNVFTNDTVADYFNRHFVNYKLDMEKGEGIQFSKTHGIHAFPSLVFVDASGQMLHRSVGSRPPQAMVALGKEAANPETQLATLDKQFSSGKRDPQFLSRYLKARSGAGLPADEVIDLHMSSVKDADFASRDNWNMINWRLEDVKSATYKRFISNREEFNKRYTRDSVDQKLLHMHLPRLMKAASSGSQAEFNQVRDEVKKLNISKSEAAILQAEATLYDHLKDTKNYSATVVKLVEGHGLNNASTLNNFAWAFYEKVDDPAMLKKAEGWSATSVKLDPSYANLDTHAALLYKLGRTAEARKEAERAITVGEKEGEDVAGTKELLQKINAKK